MSLQRHARPRLFLALLGLCLVIIVGFFASLPWLKQQTEETVFLIAGVFAALVIGASFVLDVLHERGMDEWHRANQRFSMKWGWGVGSALIALLLALPIFHDVIVRWSAAWGDVADPDRRLVLMTYMAGFMSVVIAQTVAMAVISIAWTFWKSRPARES